MEPDLVVFNGVDPVTGDYLWPPLPLDDLAHRIVGRLRQPVRRHRIRVRRAIAEVDPKDLAATGWGVVFAPDTSPEVREALQPLLDHRRDQAARQQEHLFQVYDLLPGESTSAFLSGLGAAPGPVDPQVVPYYLLLVGSPDSLPFSFQYRLDVQHGVGRLWFPDAEDYARYAARLIASEAAAAKIPASEPTSPAVPREVVFFGPSHLGDEATRLSSRELVTPLAASLPGGRSGWTGRAFLGSAASKARLASLLGGEETPSLLFTAGHGLGLSCGHDDQHSLQGALLCGEWPGPGSGPIPATCFLSSTDLPERANLRGMIAFHFACYSAGTPQWDTFAPRDERQIAPAPFLADLPLALLRRGALAVIGHIDRAWLYSFLWLHQKAQIGAFQSTLEQLLDGNPVGAAMEYFGERYAQISTELTLALDPGPDGLRIGDLELMQLWTANGDARSYVVLGDPAVRLAARP
ncbi:MAG: hypothetical protein QOF89_4486 [Acidobacteriota bacterium]|jgi:hypothetical protein|nr:hypothetical protein [Acidobacteriota bacterium]